MKMHSNATIKVLAYWGVWVPPSVMLLQGGLWGVWRRVMRWRSCFRCFGMILVECDDCTWCVKLRLWDKSCVTYFKSMWINIFVSSSRILYVWLEVPGGLLKKYQWHPNEVQNPFSDTEKKLICARKLVLSSDICWVISGQNYLGLRFR